MAAKGFGRPSALLGSSLLYMRKTFNFIDLFAGIGGFHQAMHAAGGHCVFASEWNKHARVSYETNYKSVSPEIFANDNQFFAGDFSR